MNSSYSFLLAAIFLILCSQTIYATFTTVSVSIAGGANFTNNPLVSLTITPDTQDANGMRFSCTTNFSGNFEAFATTKSNFNITAGNECTTGDGSKNVYVQLEDIPGNQLVSATPATISLETAPPTTTVSGNDNLWHQTDVVLAFSCTDSTSNCQKITVSVNGTPTDHSGNAATATISGDGNHSVTYYSTDFAGNSDTGTNPTIIVHIDNTLPTTSTDVNDNVWQRTDANVHLTCSDSGSGCQSTQYRINNGSWEPFAGSILITTEGMTVIDFNSTDTAGKVEATNTKTVKIDKTVPSTPTDLRTTLGNGQITLDWTASTDSRGIKEYELYNGADDTFLRTIPATPTSYPVTGLANGTDYSFKITAKDNAGNESLKTGVVSGKPTNGSSNNNNNNNTGNNNTTTVEDTTPPSIKWINVEESQNLTGIYKIQIDSMDDSGIDYTSLYVDSEDEKNLVEKISIRQGIFFEFSLDTSKFSNAEHSLIAVSLDNSSNQNKAISKIKVKFGEEKKENESAGENAIETETIFSKTIVFGEKDKNFINNLSLNGAERDKAIELGKILKPQRKIEITKNGNSFNLIATISFENRDLNSLKFIEIIPKEFAQNASEIDSNIAFTILSEDPIIQFDLNSLDLNKTIELRYWLKTPITDENSANLIRKNLEEKFDYAPIFLDSSTIVSKESFNPSAEKTTNPNALFSLEKIGFLPILGAIAILGFIWIFVFSMKHPLKIVQEHTVEKNVSEEKPPEIAQGTIVGETESTAKKKKSEQIKELDNVEEKLKGLRKEAN